MKALPERSVSKMGLFQTEWVGGVRFVSKMGLFQTE